MKGMKILKFKGDKYKIPRWIRADIISSVSAMALEDKETTIKIIETYEKVIENIISNGGEYRFGRLGIFRNREKKDATPLKRINFQTKQEYMAERFRHNTPIFRFNNEFRKEMIESTKRNTFKEQWESKKLENEK